MIILAFLTFFLAISSLYLTIMTSYLTNLTSSQNEKKKLITMLILQLRIFFTLLHFVSELQEKRENDDINVQF